MITLSNMRLTWIKRMTLAILAIGNCLAAEMPAEALGKLADDEFKVRESAQQEVLDWARKHEAGAPAKLFQYLRENADPEVRFRCMRILEDLARDGYAQHGKGFIGIQMMDEMVQIPGKDQPQAAVRITFVLPGMAAERAGLKVGDLIIGINDKTWPSPAVEAMRQQVMDMKPTTKINVHVLRNGKVEDVEVTLVKRPVTADNLMLERIPGGVAEAERRDWEEYFEQWKRSHDPG